MMNRGARGSRIYIGNLPYDMTGEELVNEFDSLGFTVSRPHIVMDKDTGRSKGFGFIEVPNKGIADTIVTQLNGTSIGGRTVKIDHAVDKPRNERPGQERR